ncbi:hypothetical protein VTP01DRAFT_6042 [Rhizomucor pusillus]|uniref:uncharacterized protein n=1 Tax=Rhizomucor pusillus TaxID=4840 RepID=UPI0037422E2A
MHTFDKHERQKRVTYLLISDKTGSGRSASILLPFLLVASGAFRAWCDGRIDGARLQAKKSLAFKKAQRLNEVLNRSFNALKDRLREKYARQWVSFTPVIKHAIIQQLDARRDTRCYTRDFANEDATIFIHEAPFEAYPETVPMDHKLANALYRRIKQRNRGCDSTNADIPTRVDEYLSSKMCCYCTKQGRKQRVDFLQRTPVVSEQDAARLDDGHEKVFRVVTCQNCNLVFHRDGNASDNLTSITRYMLRFQERPRWFIRPSSRQRTASDRGTTVISGSRGRPGEREIMASSGAPRRKRIASETETMVEPSWSPQQETPDSSSAPVS